MKGLTHEVRSFTDVAPAALPGRTPPALTAKAKTSLTNSGFIKVTDLLGHRRWRGVRRTAPVWIRPVTHDQFQSPAAGKVGVTEPGAVPGPAVEFRRLDVDVFFGIVSGDDDEIFSVAQMDRYSVKKRAAEDVFGARRIHRIKSHRAQHVPGRGGALVVHAGIGQAVRVAAVKLAQNFSDHRLRFPGLAGVIVKIRRLPVRLVALAILAEHAGYIA